MVGKGQRTQKHKGERAFLGYTHSVCIIFFILAKQLQLVLANQLQLVLCLTINKFWYILYLYNYAYG